MWLFLSLSGCSVHMIAGIYWRNLLSLSLCLLSSISSSEVGGQEGAEGVTPKSIPLAHKSGIFHREKKGNTYATSTHFPCFLQNQSNCKTVLYLRDPPIGHHSPSSSGYCGHAVSHRKTRCVFFKPWGSNLSQFFRIQFKGVSMELLAPICKREKKATSAIILLEANFLALDGGIDRFYNKAFLSWSDLICPLPSQALYSSLPVLPPRRGGDAPGVDLMVSLTDVQLFTITSDATRGAIRVTF